MKRRIALVLLIVSLMTFAIAPPVGAIAPPDTVPSVNAVYLYDNVLEDGDLGILIDYYLDYAVLPTETATEAYLGIFIDTDGTTQLKSTAPYTFQDSGYGRGLMWIYFTAAEVTADSIDSVDIALYRVWITGNPTLTWTGTGCPKTVATIDTWTTVDDPSTLIALRVLYYADVLELAWTLDMIEVTSLGNRLAALGESYFENVIPNLRTIAPAAFASSVTKPTKEDIDYSTSFGATCTSAVVVGSPVTLAEGANALNATGAGTATFVLNQGTSGTAAGAVVNGSPVALVAGTNTVTLTGAGAFTVTVNLVNLSTILQDTTTGTGFDLTNAANAFGMSLWVFSGVIWLLISVVICAAAYGANNRLQGQFGYEGSASKIIMVLFNLCVLGGVLLGLLHPVVGVLLFIFSMGLTVYVLVFRHASF